MGNLTPAWPRRAAALATVAGLAAGLVLLPLAAGPPPAGAARTAPAATSACTPVGGSASGSAVTCTGPSQVDPHLNSDRKTMPPLHTPDGTPIPSKVTVSQTKNLVNQDVTVSWQNFTPSSNTFYMSASTRYPVMIAECQGTDPTAPTQCYNNTIPGAQTGTSSSDIVGGQIAADGPDNTAFSYTAPEVNPHEGGIGQANIQILTKAESPTFLACDQTHPCSLVVMPAQGGNPLVPIKDSSGTAHENCSDHSFDSGGGAGTASAQFSFNHVAPRGAYSDECSWNARIVVPLQFAPVPAGYCPQVTHPQFTAQGSPMLERAFGSWQLGFCKGNNSVQMTYNSLVSEPAARGAFLNGSPEADVALTTRPASSSGAHPYTYAPVAVSGAAVAYNIDSPATGQPVSGMKLNARLLAKLLTTSYAVFAGGRNCKPPPTFPGCDNALNYDPSKGEYTPPAMYNDPEFEGLNPGLAPLAGGAGQAGLGQNQPTVLSGNSDMTYEATRWVALNPDAADFLAGNLDPWGMHVNTNYQTTAKGVAEWPKDSFTSDDQTDKLANAYVPTFPLSLVDSYLASNEDSANCFDGTPPQWHKCPPVPAGRADFYGVIDDASAASFLLPAAALQNRHGDWVTPSNASMAAALSEMSTNPDKITQYVNQQANVPGAYPLTMVIYAMVPTYGISKAKAGKIADWLDYIAGPGQVQGVGAGQLPPGYLPLPANLKAETLKAAQEVRNQTGARPPGGTSQPPGGGITALPFENTPGAIPGGSAGAGAAGGGGAGGNTAALYRGGGARGASKLRPTRPGAIHPPNSLKLPTVGNKPLAYGRPVTAGITRFALIALLIAGGLFALTGPGSVVLSKTNGGALIIAEIRRIGTRLGTTMPVRASIARFPARTIFRWMRSWRTKP